MTNEEVIKILKNEYLCRINIKDGCYPWKCKNCEYSEDKDDVTQAINYAISELSNQSASSEQDDHIAEPDKMVKLEKRTITERLIIAESLINSVIADFDQFREDTKMTDSEQVSLSEQEKSNSFLKEPSDSNDSKMNCSDVPDIRIGKTDFKPETVTNCHDLMDDLIRRKDAVSRISDLLVLELKYERLPTYNEVYHAINDIPSAQPEIANNLYLYKCYITDEDGLQHEVIHTGDIRRVTGWEI